jgi:hypothetical protein
MKSLMGIRSYFCFGLLLTRQKIVAMKHDEQLYQKLTASVAPAIFGASHLLKICIRVLALSLCAWPDLC